MLFGNVFMLIIFGIMISGTDNCFSFVFPYLYPFDDYIVVENREGIVYKNGCLCGIFSQRSAKRELWKIAVPAGGETARAELLCLFQAIRYIIHPPSIVITWAVRYENETAVW